MSESFSAVPGVFRAEVAPQPHTGLSTGIPGFVGFAQPRENSAGVRALGPVSVRHREEFFAAFETPPGSYLAAAVNGFFENGGHRCLVVGTDRGEDPEKALLDAVDQLALADDIDLVAVPDAMTLTRLDGNGKPALDAPAVIRVQRKVLEHCVAQRDRFAILDCVYLPPGDNTIVKILPADILGQRDEVVAGLAEPVNGALYAPWIRTMETVVPPCGHIAGIYARTDARVGVFKAPANEEVLGCLDLEPVLSKTDQEELHPVGINCLRVFPGRGIRIWGARTLSRTREWQYVNVRRLFLSLSRWIEQNLAWAGFEPNTPRLWVRIQRQLDAHLTGLWRMGALKGDSPTEGFYIKCDLETNPPEVRDSGQVVTEIGLAPLAPAEFVVVRIIQRPGSSDLG